jgi:magnesium chelatase accessory protein
VDHAPHRWHLQVAGSGPVLLLLHGAGASTHSFRALVPDLGRDFTVVALDLPGQGFTRAGDRMRCGLAPMATDIAAMLAAEGLRPDLIAGHSAGAAIALEMARHRAPRAILALNGALGPFRGLAGVLFPPLAKMLALNPLTAPAFAWLAGAGRGVERLIASTGSRIDAEGLACYRALVTDPAHVDATLAMMAQWDLAPLIAALPGIAVPVTLVTGGRDTAVPPDTSDRAARALPQASREHHAGLGHLLHEERPDIAAEAIRRMASRVA